MQFSPWLLQVRSSNVQPSARLSRFSPTPTSQNPTCHISLGLFPLMPSYTIHSPSHNQATSYTFQRHPGLRVAGLPTPPIIQVPAQGLPPPIEGKVDVGPSVEHLEFPWQRNLYSNNYNRSCKVFRALKQCYLNCEWARSIVPRNWLEMWTLGSHPRPTELGSSGLGISILTSPLGE